MQSRRDQIQAHGFVVGRLVNGLLVGEPELPRGPLRRQSVGMYAGIAIGVLALAGAAIWGFVFPGGSTAWRSPGALIEERDTTNRYVFDGTELHPVLNYASARLLLGAQMKIVSVSRASLSGVPTGLPVGIVGAPDAVPKPSALSTAPWLVCATRHPDVSGADRPDVTVAIGGIAGTVPPADGAALLVQTPNHNRYLIWQRWRLRVPSEKAAVALNVAADVPLAVTDTWADTVPAGPDLTPPPVPGLGSTGTPVAGTATTVGQVFTVHGVGAPATYYLALADGLEPINQTTAALLLADPAEAAAYQGHDPSAIPLDTAGLASAHLLPAPVLPDGFPPSPPKIWQGSTTDTTACVAVTPNTRTDPGIEPVLTPSAALAGGTRMAAPPGHTAPGRILVAPGTGLLVRALTAPADPAVVAPGAEYLVTEVGQKFALGGSRAAAALGYGTSSILAMPPELLNLFPSGPVLSVSGASAPLAVGQDAPTAGSSPGT